MHPDAQLNPGPCNPPSGWHSDDLGPSGLLLPTRLADPIEPSLRLPIGDIDPLVVLSLSTGEPQQHLCKPPTEIQLQGYDRRPALTDRALPLVDLPSVQQQLAGSKRIVVLPVAEFVWRNMTLHQRHLATVYRGIRILQIGPTCSQRLDLRTGKDQPCLDRFLDAVFVAGLPIGDHRLRSMVLITHGIARSEFKFSIIVLFALLQRLGVRHKSHVRYVRGNLVEEQ